MYVPEELKLNKFKQVRLRTRKEIFNLVQKDAVPPPSAFSGEDEYAPVAQNKLDQISQADYECRDQLSNE